MTTMPPPPPEQPGDPTAAGSANAFGMPSYGGDVQPGFAGMGSIPPPPGVWVGPPLAEWPLRALSFVIDVAIAWLPWWILAEVLDSPGLGLLTWLIVFLYIQYAQGTTGQSPGKRVAKTRLLREADGQPLGFGLAVMRGILHYIVDLFSCTLGFFWPLWDAKRQTFSDKIVSSVVVRGS